MFDGKFKDVFFWELMRIVEVFKWSVIIESVVSVLRLALCRVLKDEGGVHFSVVHCAELALSWTEELVRVLGAGFSHF